MEYAHIETPLGAMTIAADATAIRHAFFTDQPNAIALDGMCRAGDNALLDEARAQLLACVDGSRRDVDVPLAPRGTDFQRAVWAALGEIPCGRTVTYTQLALMLGRGDAVRAAAQAIARNPIMILVPCHRVVGVDGRLTGFSAGLERKQRLLEIERTAAPQ